MISTIEDSCWTCLGASCIGMAGSPRRNGPNPKEEFTSPGTCGITPPYVVNFAATNEKQNVRAKKRTWIAMAQQTSALVTPTWRGNLSFPSVTLFGHEPFASLRTTKCKRPSDDIARQTTTHGNRRQQKTQHTATEDNNTRQQKTTDDNLSTTDKPHTHTHMRTSVKETGRGWILHMN
eukprot:scaffold8601_cov191-Amphora_coffeaeformis.AAC.5